jgi:hypothetical protein
MEQYLDLARRAIGILQIAVTEDAPLELLVKQIRCAMFSPMTTNEWEIARLSSSIAEEIERRGDARHIEGLLEKLAFEVSYALFD